MAYLVFDIETVKDPEIISAWKPRDPVKDTFPPPIFWEPIAIGMLWVGGTIERPTMKFGMIGTALSERERLEAFAKILNEENPPTFVTWNGRHFDFPVLLARALKHGVSFAGYYRHKGMRYRYDDEGHFDVKDFLSDFGAADHMSLDPAVKAMGLPGKMEIDGDSVAALYAAKRIAEIEAYCLQDVAHLGFALMRTRLMQGSLSLGEYQDLAGALWRLCEADPRVEAVVKNAKRDRVLLSDQQREGSVVASEGNGVAQEDWLV